MLRLLGKDRALAVFEELEPDDRVRMLREAPAKVAKRVLAELSPHERWVTCAPLGYTKGSVGRYRFRR